jgi:hypothetical protein
VVIKYLSFQNHSTSHMPTRVSEGRRAISEEARPSAREEAFPSCRPTTKRLLLSFSSVKLRFLRVIRVLLLPSNSISIWSCLLCLRHTVWRANGATRFPLFSATLRLCVSLFSFASLSYIKFDSIKLILPTVIYQSYRSRFVDVVRAGAFHAPYESLFHL